MPAPSVARTPFHASATRGGGGLFGHRRPLLKGRVAVGEEMTVVGRRVDVLLDRTLDRDPKTALLNQAVQHYQTKRCRVAAQAKDVADFLFNYRGLSQSIEAGDIITGERLKLKSRAAAEYARQKHIDELHTRIVSNVMQIAMGLGMSDRARGDRTINYGIHRLQPLVGKDAAVGTAEMLANWAQGIRVPEQIFNQPEWDVEHRNEMSSFLVKSAMRHDPVVCEIFKHLHKYNHRTRLARASSRVLDTVFGVLSRNPATGHAGIPLLVASVLASGGPEQAKIMKELYLDRRLASRLQVINDEAHMALDNYQLAVLTRNPPLLACSESVIQDLAGAKVVPKLFGRSVLAQSSRAGNPAQSSRVAQSSRSGSLAQSSRGTGLTQGSSAVDPPQGSSAVDPPQGVSAAGLPQSSGGVSSDAERGLAAPPPLPIRELHPFPAQQSVKIQIGSPGAGEY